MSPEEAKAHIFDIQKYSIHDGPGIRTLVFFQGCPLRCLWCSNPEGQSQGAKLFFSANRCVNCGACVPACQNGVHELAGTPRRHSLRRANCTGRGACVAACPEEALALSGKEWALSDILAVILEDREFYETSGGGLTIGGGEPLAQWRAAISLLEACHAEGINTALETSGYAPRDVLELVAPHVDLFLYDIKHTDPDRHKALTGADNAGILENLAFLLDSGHAVRVRMPLIAGCNAGVEEMRARVAFLAPWKGAANFLGVDLLPYHRLGVSKYARLGMEYRLDERASVPEGQLDACRRAFADAGMNVTVIRH